MFADKEGYLGAFEGVYPGSAEGVGGSSGEWVESGDVDPLIDDSLLMEVRVCACACMCVCVCVCVQGFIQEFVLGGETL